MEKFIALFDAHVGSEINSSRHKVTLHDEKAISVAMQFIADFHPHHVVLGGDMLDCGAISHHTKGRVGQLEGLRLLADAKDLCKTIIAPLEAQVKGRLVYHIGNHEDWLNDLVDDTPALEGIVDIRSLLDLGKRWEVIEQGKSSRLGKMTFVHGDTIKGGDNPAKWAVNAYEKSIFFGHYHTNQAYTKVSEVASNGHIGVSVPCLCKKSPRYGGGSPNRWSQGLLFGYVNPNGTFNAYVATIIDGKAVIQGKAYRG